MKLGVRFATSDRRLAAEFSRALDFWATVLDMEWHEQADGDCSLAVVDGDINLFRPAEAARAQFPNVPAFQGWIAFNPTNALSQEEQYMIAVHELGHVFGLPHNESTSSVMYFLCLEGRAFLDSADLTKLAAHHKLRVSGQGEPLAVNTPIRDETRR